MKSVNPSRENSDELRSFPQFAIRQTGYLSVMHGLCKQKVFSGELRNDAIQFQAQ